MGRAIHRWLAGDDGPGRRALPAGEFLHPVPLAALVVLGVNDHLLKGRGALPAWVTGKLSDLCGLLFFPLLVTAVADVVAYGVARATGARVDFSLRRWKLAAAIVLTAAVFVPLELSAAWGELYVRTLGRLGFPSDTTRDPTDLVALVMLVPAWWLGVAELRRVPLGRLEVLARAPDRGVEAVRAGLADVRRLARDPAAVDVLGERYAAYLARGGAADAAPVEAALRALRG